MCRGLLQLEPRAPNALKIGARSLQPGESVDCPISVDIGRTMRQLLCLLWVPSVQ